MATVSEDSLQRVAKEIVSEFQNGGDLTTLTKGKVKDLGYNKDQASRLIERTNSEAFLSLFPNKTEFKVADPKVILADFEPKPANESNLVTDAGEAKTASTKTASSTGTSGRRSYTEMMSMDFDEIFGIEDVEKRASYTEPGMVGKSELLDKVYAKRIEEEIRVEKVAKDLEVEECSDKLWQLYKQATLNGKPTNVTEEELLLSFPNKPREVCNLVSTFNEKLASDGAVPRRLLKRASVEGFNPRKIVDRNDVIDQFGELIRLVDSY